MQTINGSTDQRAAIAALARVSEGETTARVLASAPGWRVVMEDDSGVLNVHAVVAWVPDEFGSLWPAVHDSGSLAPAKLFGKVVAVLSPGAEAPLENGPIAVKVRGGDARAC